MPAPEIKIADKATKGKVQVNLIINPRTGCNGPLDCPEDC
jgi:hypothetical protein